MRSFPYIVAILVSAGLSAAQSPNADQGRCTAFGTLHLYTFDGKLMDYYAPCKYDLVTPCSTFVSNTFKVRIKNEPVYPNVGDSVVSVQYIEVLAEDKTVQLYKNGSVFVQGALVDAYNHKCRLNVERVRSGWQASLRSAGVNILLTQAGKVVVTVSDRYKGKLCGLCGNYDGIASNDDSSDQHWLVPGSPSGLCQLRSQRNSNCAQVPKLNEMLNLPDFCGVFDSRSNDPVLGDLFGNCLRSFPQLATDMAQMCTNDFCQNAMSLVGDAVAEDVSSGCLQDESQHCYVNNVTAKAAVCRLADFLAGQCIALGQPPQVGWRDTGALDCRSSTMQCPGGSTYSTRVTALSSTKSCTSLNCGASAGDSLSSSALSSDGCQCGTDQSWLGSTCVAAKGSRCGCVYGSSSYFKEGDQWMDISCSANLTCLAGGQLNYTSVSCAPRATCINSAGQGSCRCPGGYSGDGITRCTYTCPPGQMTNDNNDGCIECPVGTYQSSSGQTFCVSCPTGYVTEESGSISNSSCINAVRLIPDSQRATPYTGLDVVVPVTIPASVLPNGIPFGTSRYRSLSVSSNGIVTFGQSYVGEVASDPRLVNIPLVAAMWYRQDLRKPPSSLTVSQYSYVDASTNAAYSATRSSDSSLNAAESAARLQLIDKTLALTQQVSGSYTSKWALTATWKESVSYPYQWYSNNGVHENCTYQVVVSTDGQTTYVMLLYPRNQTYLSKSNLYRQIYMGYSDGKQGYTLYASGTPNMAQIDSLTSNTARRGMWLFSFSSVLRVSPEGLFCLKWYNNEAPMWTVKVPQLTPCPCNIAQARGDPNFIVNSTSLCAVSSTPGGFGYYQMCCYSRDRGALLSDDQSGTRPLKYNPFREAGSYTLNDYQPFFNCCISSVYCSLYRECRPADSCTLYRPPRTAVAYGDPHFVLLDSGLSYTYNPIGEFHLVKSSSMNVQVRTGFSNSSGVEGGGTVFLAVAGKATPSNSSRVHVEINPNGTDFIVCVQSPDRATERQYSSMFSAAAPDGVLETFVGVAIFKIGSSLRISFDTGYTLIVSIKVTGMLALQTYVPASDIGKGALGLLGSYDGNPNNDLTLRNGSVVTCPTINGTFYDSRCIYETFGESWRIEPEESIFWYRPAFSSRLYTDKNFRPLLEVVYTDEVSEMCGSDLACAYDFVVTQRHDVANATRETTSEATGLRTALGNMPPWIDGPPEWNAYVGSQVTVSYTIAGDLEDSILELLVLEKPNNCNITRNKTNTYIVSWLPQPADIYDNHTLRMVAVDASHAVSSAEFVVTVRLCRECGSQGQCRHTVVAANGYVSNEYVIYACECNTGWTGLDCTTQYSGCTDDTCSSYSCPSAGESNVTDISNSSTNQSCGLECRYGFTSTYKLDDFAIERSYCFDVDECATNASVCSNGGCLNTLGSYSCSCDGGYQLTDSGDCTDKDECEFGGLEVAPCEQLCYNIPGSYECACFEGFELVNNTGQCRRADAQGQAHCQLNCSYACTNSSKDGSWHCICPNGYAFANAGLGDDGSPCDDIDECAPGGGSRCSPEGIAVCNNTLSSYTCTCPAGFSISNDGVTCRACPPGFWGLHCTQRCDCSDRATMCDPVRGCINCRSGWSGEQCLVDVDECRTLSPCPANSYCSNSIGSYWCACNRGFRPSIHGDTQCVDVNECNSYSPCSPYATCNNLLGNYTCTCLPGYTGDGITCFDIDECTEADLIGNDLCSPLATCTNIAGWFFCSCPYGYYGDGSPQEGCTDIDECLSPFTCPESLNLTCNNYPGTFSCSCLAGYRRDDNSTVDRCIPDVCGGRYIGQCSEVNQVCVNTSSQDYKCECIAGYKMNSGSVCENVNECLNASSCALQPNTDCVDSQGNYSCKCKAGFQDIDGVCADINECALGSGLNNCTAENSSNCVNTPGSYSCVCTAGFYKTNGTCKDIDECALVACPGEGRECPTRSPCGTNARCDNTVGNYTCTCLHGYASNGTSCIDVDECQSASSVCHPLANCTNTPGSYTCECATGYAGNGSLSGNCEDVNECLLPSTCPAGLHQTCTNLPGTFACPCAVGYRKAENFTADGCVEDLCDERHYGRCRGDHQTCVNSTAGYVCECSNGYAMNNGSTCIKKDECLEPAICSAWPNTICVNGQGNFSCQCMTGYERNGISGPCTDIDECNMEAIYNNCSAIDGQCVNTPGGYNCTCANGFYRVNDSCKDINECVKLVGVCTKPNEMCSNTAGSYSCTCMPGYEPSGNRSCVDVDECASAQTNNCSGPLLLCNNTAGSYQCVCKPGYSMGSSARCIDIDECKMQNATCPYEKNRCVNTDGSFSCLCIDGFVPKPMPSRDCRMKDGDTSVMVIQLFKVPAAIALSEGLEKLFEDSLRMLFETSLFKGFSGIRIIDIKPAKVSINGALAGREVLAQLTPDETLNVTYEVVYNSSLNSGTVVQSLLIQLKESNGSLSLNGTTIYAESDIVYALLDGSFVTASCDTTGCPTGYVCQSDGACHSMGTSSSTASPDELTTSIDFTAIWAAVGVAAGLLLAGLVACISVVACRRRHGAVMLHREPRGSQFRAPIVSGQQHRGATLTRYAPPSSTWDSISTASDTSSGISYENATHEGGDMSQPFAPRWPRAYPSRESRTVLNRRHSNTGSNVD